MAEARLLAYQTDGIYRLYDIKTKKIVISRDVIFQEMPPTDLPKPSYDLDAVHKPSADQAMNRDEMERQRRRFAPAEFLPSGDDDHPNETDDIDQIEDHTDH
ncbi:periplasmic binding protein-like II [Penicillium atrosanguineum]|nr:periplasmic binding protein-like II [Penicillium atrosanguineum]KAJ5298141.1 periplasmic binding protein-like II [Penicillium atrosanguineum]